MRVPYYIGDLKRDPNLENYALPVAQDLYVAPSESQDLLIKAFGGSFVASEMLVVQGPKAANVWIPWVKHTKPKILNRQAERL